MMILIDILSLDRIFGAEYPLIIKQWVFPLTIGLLSLSMPLLINSIIRIESSYPKNNIGKLILRERSILRYFAFIGITVISTIVYLLQLPRNYDFESATLNRFVDHSAEILLTLSAVGFLFSVLNVTCFILKNTINTNSLYQYYRKNVKKYFKQAANSQNKDFEGKIANKYKLQEVLIIVEKAFEEQNHSLYKDIISDFNEGVKIYREQYFRGEQNQRHLMVDYPSALRNELYDLTQTCFRTNEVNVQEEVFGLLQTIYFDYPPKYGDIPQAGLSFSSLVNLWSILIDAINRKQTEFVKFHWDAIYKYTKMMFHAYAITNTDKNFLRDLKHYDLQVDDKYELAMIAYMHFMIQAYIYEKKEYDTLQYLLEYDNKYREVPELIFLYIEEALKAYKTYGLSKDDTSSIVRRPTLAMINKELTYSSYRTTNDWTIQQDIIDNYLAFIVTYCYNYKGDVPVCSISDLKFSRTDYEQLLRAFKSMSTLPSISINNVVPLKVMKEEEYKFFLGTLKPRSRQEELAFLNRTNCRTQNVNVLYGSIKGTLSYEIPHNIFVWTHESDYIRTDNSVKNTEEVESSYFISKEKLIYESGLRELSSISFDVAQNHLREIDVKVVLSSYATQAHIKTKTVDGDELGKIINNLFELDRVIFFYAKTKEVEKLARAIDFSYENRRDYLSTKKWSSRKSIKCVRLPMDNPEAMILENQIWILPHDEQPVVNFIDIDDKADYASLHSYGREPIDREEEWFSDIPLYTKYRTVDNNFEKPMVQVFIKNKIEVLGLQKMKAKVYKLGNSKPARVNNRKAPKAKIPTQEDLDSMNQQS